MGEYQVYINYLMNAVAALVIFFAARWGAALVSKLIETRLTKTNFDKTLTRFFANAARWAIMIAAVIAILGKFGVNTTSFAALIGAGGLAAGLAFQGSLSNFAAGVMLLVFRPFKVGDVISVAGVVGGVDEIGLFTTTLDTLDNRRIIVPNKAIFGQTIENVTHHPIRRCDVNVGCDYSADVDKTRAVLQAAADAVKGSISEPGAQIVLVSLGASSVDWQVRVWCNTGDYFAVLEQTTRDVKVSLDKAGIGIPYNTIDINIIKGAA